LLFLVDISGCNSWLLLGPKIERKPSGLNGLTLTVSGTASLTRGPGGLNAWVFNGQTYVRISNDGSLDLGRYSFTISTYVYQDVLRDGPIVEWRGSYAHGTHMWIYQRKLFANLNAFRGTRSAFIYNVPPPSKRWSFMGISFNHKTGELMTWVNNNVIVRNVGQVGIRDMTRDLYIGIRPAIPNPSNTFVGKLAGTTLMKCPITRGQITTLKNLIMARAKSIGKFFNSDQILCRG
jgi:hypothetical protein